MTRNVTRRTWSVLNDLKCSQGANFSLTMVRQVLNNNVTQIDESMFCDPISFLRWNAFAKRYRYARGKVPRFMIVSQIWGASCIGPAIDREFFVKNPCCIAIMVTHRYAGRTKRMCCILDNRVSIFLIIRR